MWQFTNQILLRKFLILSVLLITGGFALSACTLGRQNLSVSQQLMNSSDHSLATFVLRGKNYRFEIVNTNASTEQGLSGRAQIGSDGLLFAFPQLEYQRFWMKEMKFDLDLIWLQDLKIIDITPQVPHPTQQNPALPVYVPKLPVNQVLELPAGQAAAWKLQLGDTFALSQ